jgi:hypothetical protein
MPQSNFELSDDFLYLKSHITNMFFARCYVGGNNKSKSPKTANIYIDFISWFYMETMKIEWVERLSDDPKAKQNLQYIEFIIHRKQHCVLWCGTLFGVDGVGK